MKCNLVKKIADHFIAYFHHSVIEFYFDFDVGFKSWVVCVVSSVGIKVRNQAVSNYLVIFNEYL